MHARSLRGMTLLELMITLAVAAIIAALAVPNLTPLLLGQRVSMTAEEVTSFLERARRMAAAEGRCVRVVEPEGSDTLVLLRLERPECVSDASGPWSMPLAVMRPSARVTLGVESLPGNTPDDVSIVFRPNGRLRGDADLDVSDDGARVVVAHGAIEKQAEVLVAANGRVCWRAFTSSSLPALAGPVVCRKGAL